MKKEKGFTLIELLVVIAIIALLMAILMPALASVKDKARAVACQSNLKQWGVVFHMYTEENDGYFQEGWTIRCRPGDRWFNMFRPYFGDNNDILFCPMAGPSNIREVYGVPTGMNGPFSAWGKHEGPTGEISCTLRGTAGSYGNNMWCANPTAETGHDKDAFWRITAVKGGGDIPLLADSGGTGGWVKVWNEPPLFYGNFDKMGHIEPMKAFCIDRHDEHTNILFLDYTVRKVGLKELWELKWHRKWVKEYQDRPTEWDDPEHWMFNMKDYELIRIQP